MSHSESCLVAKLSHYVELTETSRRELRQLEEAEENYARGTDVNDVGDVMEHLYVVRHGWLYSYADLPDGRRQIVKIHHPGDIIGFPDVAFRDTTTSLRAAEDCCLCPFPKASLAVAFSNSPQLVTLLFSIAARDHAILVDTIRAIGRMSAREKIAYLLLDLVCRLRISNRTMSDTFRLPINQSEIADTVGLTNVYVSRTLVALERDGYIHRKGVYVTLLKEAEMRRMTDFQDRYSEMDTRWFPV